MSQDEAPYHDCAAAEQRIDALGEIVTAEKARAALVHDDLAKTVEVLEQLRQLLIQAAGEETLKMTGYRIGIAQAIMLRLRDELKDRL